MYIQSKQVYTNILLPRAHLMQFMTWKLFPSIQNTSPNDFNFKFHMMFLITIRAS